MTDGNQGNNRAVDEFGMSLGEESNCEKPGDQSRKTGAMSNQAEQWATQRRLMVDRQLRGRGIADERVLEVMGRLPRELFIPQDRRSYAYDDNPVLLEEGQTISQPYIVALMSEKLDVRSDHKVLEIGTGCGYQTAILAGLAGKVYTIERIASLAKQGRRNLEALGIDNVEYLIGDGSRGWPVEMVFDRIIATAAAESIPKRWEQQLAEGGKMVAPIGSSGSQQLLLLEKRGKEFRRTLLCYCRFVELIRDNHQ